MSTNQLEVSLSLTNQKVRFIGVSTSNPDHPIAFDYLPPIGDGQGFLGLELLLMSFSGCVSTGIVFLLRKMGKSVSGYRANAIGTKRMQPISLEKIHFEIVLESSDTTDSDVVAVLKQAEVISPVWAAIRNNVEVTTGYTIVSP